MMMILIMIMIYQKHINPFGVICLWIYIIVKMIFAQIHLYIFCAVQEKLVVDRLVFSQKDLERMRVFFLTLNEKLAI